MSNATSAEVPGGVRRFRVVLRATLLTLTWIALAALLWSALSEEGSWRRVWLKYYLSTPPIATMIGAALLVSVCWLGSRLPSAALDMLLCGLAALALFETASLQGMGDPRWKSIMTEPIIYLSEPLGNLVYHVVYRLGGGTNHVAPVFGGLAMAAWIHFLRILPYPRRSREHLLLRLLLPSLGPWMLFFHGNIEITFLALPAFLLFLRGAVRYRLAGVDVDGPGVGVRLGALFSLTALFHGEYSFMLPVVPILVAMRHAEGVPRRTAAATVAAFLGTTAMIVAGVFLVLFLAGFEIRVGNTTGGGDGQMFVPLSARDASAYASFLMFSMGHLLQVANILFHAIPLAGILWFAMPMALAARRPTPTVGPPRGVLDVAALTAGGAVAMVCLWNFDLRFPLDIDLMLSITPPFALYVFLEFWRIVGHQPRVLALGLFLNALVSMGLGAYFLAPRI